LIDCLAWEQSFPAYPSILTPGWTSKKTIFAFLLSYQATQRRLE